MNLLLLSIKGLRSFMYCELIPLMSSYINIMQWYRDTNHVSNMLTFFCNWEFRFVKLLISSLYAYSCSWWKSSCVLRVLSIKTGWTIKTHTIAKRKRVSVSRNKMSARLPVEAVSGESPLNDSENGPQLCKHEQRISCLFVTSLTVLRNARLTSFASWKRFGRKLFLANVFVFE